MRYIKCIARIHFSIVIGKLISVEKNKTTTVVLTNSQDCGSVKVQTTVVL